MITCTKCKEKKEVKEFYLNKNPKIGRSSQCKNCIAKYKKKMYKSKKKIEIKHSLIKGTKINFLTLISFEKGKGWKCLCVCNNYSFFSSADLKIGRSKSCGCKRGLDPGIAARNTVIINYKSSAKRRNILWLLTDDQINNLFQGNCYYCGTPPSNKAQSPSNKTPYIYNGIDRLDSSKNYEIPNTVPCCKICNRSKSNLSIKDWYNWLSKVKIK